MRSLAAILVERGEPLVVDELEVPSPGPSEVLVRLYFSGVCHSQLHQIRSEVQPLPALLGHEATGVAEAVGSDVRHVREGDRVFVTWVPRRPGLGTNASRPTPIRWRGQELATGDVFSWAEHSLCDESRVLKAPNDLPVDLMAIVGCAVITGCGAVTNTARVQAGETVVVFGVGGVGLCAIQAAANVGARLAIAVDLDEAKLNLARQFGATHVVNARIDDPVEAVQELTGGGADYAFDAVGAPTTMQQMLAATRPMNWGVSSGGQAILVGVPQSPVLMDLLPLLMGERIYRGSLGGSAVPERDIPTYVQWYRQGRLPLDKLVTRRYRLGEINEAVRALEHGEILGRSIVELASP